MALEQDQIDRAYRMFYGDGKSIGEIAQNLGCGIYALTPWLFAPQRRIVAEATQSRDDHIASLLETLGKIEGEKSDLRMKIKRLQKKLKAAKDKACA